MGKPILYNVVDNLYHSVMDKLPQALQAKDMAIAPTLGLIGSYLVVRGLQWTSKNIIDKFIPNFDEKWLPKLEKACTFSMAIAPLVYLYIDSEGAKEIMTQHPTYTSGMAGVYFGSLAGAVQDLNKRKLEDSFNL